MFNLECWYSVLGYGSLLQDPNGFSLFVLPIMQTFFLFERQYCVVACILNLSFQFCFCSAITNRWQTFLACWEWWAEHRDCSYEKEGRFPATLRKLKLMKMLLRLKQTKLCSIAPLNCLTRLSRELLFFVGGFCAGISGCFFGVWICANLIIYSMTYLPNI